MLIKLLALLPVVQSALGLPPYLEETIANWLDRHLPTSHMAHNLTAKALFETIDTPKIMAGQHL